MPDDLKPTAMQEHYARGLELERLAESTGQLEFERTKEIILRHLPSPPAVVADIGGGPGRYALEPKLSYQRLSELAVCRLSVQVRLRLPAPARPTAGRTCCQRPPGSAPPEAALPRR
jgi:hypothetical protein